MLASLHLIKYAPPRRTKESIAQDEYECPLCGCITSAFAPACLECGAAFDEEEMDEAIREQFASEGDAALLAFYDARLAEKPEDPDLLYARGLLLQTMGRTDEAIETLDRAAAAAPDERKIKVAQLRIQAKELRKPDAAEKLRSTASALLDDVAWDQEIAQLDHLISESGPTCPSCGSTVPNNVALCPSCGARLASAPLEPAAKRSATGARELDILVDDLLVGELEQSLSPEELELTKAAVLDWLIEELEETMGVDATLFAILIAGFLFIPVPGPTPPIAIDGSFGDWASVPKFDAATVASDPYVSIVNYASLVDDNSLYLFASTRGGGFGDSSAYDGVYFLIDADGNPSTGYQFGGIGAEGVVEVFGSNNSVAGARLYRFPPHSEVNWGQRPPA